MISKDEQYMRRCLQLAQLGAGHAAPNPMVGAVLVYQDRIIGEGYHQQYGGPHAEVNCIASVKDEWKKYIPESTIYVSLEPCAHFGKTPPCADLIIRNKISKVVIGCRDPFEAVNGKGIEKLQAAGIEVQMSTLHATCIHTNRRFFTFHIKKRPYIILKWAQTADGFIAPLDQQKKGRLFISNEITNRLVHRWRMEESAILVGKQTAILDHPSLNNRLWTGKSPVRMLIDRHRAVPIDNPILDGKIPSIIFTEKSETDQPNLHFELLKPDEDALQVLANYSYSHQLQSILVEGGSKLLQSFLDQDLWDEIRIITNETLYTGCGTSIPHLNQKLPIAYSQKIGNNRIDYLHNPTLKLLQP